MRLYMQKLLPFILTSLSSAILAVGLYRALEPSAAPVAKTVSTVRAADRVSTPYEVSPHYLQPTVPGAFTQASSLTTPTVVNITALKQGNRFGFLQEDMEGMASGSGVIIAENGLIVTNNHVVERSEEILVTLQDKREFRAELLGTDPSTDLALLRIEATGLRHIQFGNSDSLQVGEWVLAVGNPFNLESTVTAGIVSAKGRSIDILEGQDRIESFIQTDAVVNPGNSGGALVNTRGELIGINTAIMTESGRYEGYSFAVPSNLARKVIEDLRDYGMVQRGLLGVYIEPLNVEAARALGLEYAAGVLVTRVTPGSGAADAGLKRNDVILKINDIPTRTMSEMQEQVGLYRPGNTLRIELWRQGTHKVVRVQLKDKRNSTAIVKAMDDRILKKLGVELRNLSETEKKSLKRGGVKVASVRKNSILDATNLRPDFIITRVNDRAVYTVEEFLKALRAVEGSRVTLRGFYEGERDPYYYVFDMELGFR